MTSKKEWRQAYLDLRSAVENLRDARMDAVLQRSEARYKNLPKKQRKLSSPIPGMVDWSELNFDLRAVAGHHFVNRLGQLLRTLRDTEAIIREPKGPTV